jgi:hypothetical protein
MTSLARLPHVSGHLHGRIVEQLLQTAAAAFVQGVPEFFLQAPHHRPSPRQGQLLLSPIQQEGGFLEPLLLGGLFGFFLTSGI